MSKPELPKKIDPLPPPKAPDAKPPAAKKTGWEPPAPQKPRVSERKLGMLLAVCLLVALGYVSYRKLLANRLPAAQAGPVAKKFDTLPPDDSGNSPPADQDASHSLPPADLGQRADRRLVSDAPDPTQMESAFGGSNPSVPPESPIDTADDRSRSTTAFEFGAPEPPAQAEPEPEQGSFVSADESDNPFSGAAETAVESAEDVATVASDPFAAGGVAVSDSDTTTFSSDATMEFGGEIADDPPPQDNEVTFNEPPGQSEPEPSAPADASPAPVVGLFTIEPADDAGSEPAVQLETRSPDASPWGAEVPESSDNTGLAESEPPLIEPNDAQEMPVLTISPFDGAASDSTAAAEPVVSEPAESNPGFNPYPAATVDMPVQPRVPTHAPPEEPFTSGGTTTIVQRATNSLQDPFAPARDVQHAIREDEVLMHEVQTGDNFWNIARQHYGSGKYFTALAAYNQTLIPDPRRIRPGMKVQVPSATVLAQQFPQLVSGGVNVPYAAPPAGPPGFSIDPHGHPCYRIATGDTLSGIAQKHLGRASRWRQIFGMNIDQLTSADSLTTGMVLRLPADATQIRMDAAGIGSR